MKLIDKNNLVFIQDSTLEQEKAIDSLLSIKADSLWFKKKGKFQNWDGIYRFYNKKYKCFPAGFIELFLSKYKNLEYVDNNTKPNIDITKLVPGLRDYQETAVKAVLLSRRGLIELPTGTGKSKVISGICSVIRGNIIVIVPTVNLLYQTKKVLELDLKEEIGVIGDGQFLQKRVTVGIYKSVSNLEQEDLDFYTSFIVDENQKASANTLYKLLLRSKAYYRIGLSADGLDKHKVRQDSKYKRARIVGAIGPVIYKSKPDNILAKAKIKVVELQEQADDLDYDQAYCKYLCENDNLTNKILELCESHKSNSILILVKHIHHGENISKKLKLKHAWLHGELDSKFINSKIADFNDNKLNIIIGSTIFNEGVDMPGIDVLINAAGDVAPTLQRIGRGLRKKLGKDEVVIYDFYIKGPVFTERHFKKRMKIYLHEGHEFEK